MRTPLRSCLTAATAALAMALVATSTPAWAATLTPFQMPFPCGQAWTGSTRPGHSPSPHSVDWNRPNDAGAPVVAAAPGVVTVASMTGGGYGQYVVVDHQNGESSLYAHLASVTVAVGQRVDQAAMVGTVGATGNARGTHLHFEEKAGRAVVPAFFASLPFAVGLATSANCVDVPLAGNFAGDAAAEVAVYRRARRSTFVVNDPSGVPRVLPFGKATDEPVLGDWDGDGQTNLGLRIPKRSMFKLQTPGGLVKFRFGNPADRPVSGDWDGSGTAEVGVRRSETATFYLRMADGTVQEVPLGDADDLPLTGDWDGDRRTDLAVYDQATATFTLRVVDPNGHVWLAPVVLGVPGDLPVAGDWNGDGITELGVWSPTTATFVQGRAAAPATARMTTTQVRFGRPRR